MKFTDGYWLLRPGVSTHHAAEVAGHPLRRRAPAHPYAPVKHVRGRGDTLNSPLLTVDCWSPGAEGVIGIRPHTPAPDRSRPDRSSPCQGAEPGTGKVRRERPGGRAEHRRAHAPGGHLRALAAGVHGRRTDPDHGRRTRALGFVTDAGAATSCSGSSRWPSARRVRAGRAVHAVRQERPGGGHLERRRRHSQRAGVQEHAVLPDQPRLRRASSTTRRGVVRGRLGERQPVQFSVEGQTLEYLRRLRARPRRRSLRAYTALTGRPALPPAWSFGLWLTTSFTTDYDEDTVTASSTAWPSGTSR